MMFPIFLINGFQLIHLIVVLMKPDKIVDSPPRIFWKLGSLLITGFLVVFYLQIFETGDLDCCQNSRGFSPDHVPTIVVWIILGYLALAVSTLRLKLFPPLLEVIVNICLLAGFILNLFIGIHLFELWYVGPLFIGLVFLTALIESHIRISNEIATFDERVLSPWLQRGIRVLKYSSGKRFGSFLLLLAPFFVLITSILLIFGQKANSIILAFTQTYYRTFSELTYQCDNVICGGHYLCSVAANGHEEIVKPQRLGFRAGNPIICNRQLLASNAFEEVISEKLPGLHHWIRRHYDKVGDTVHKHYHIFNIKWVSDVIFILMKPLEWMFIIALYLTDRHPEDRIQLQYLHEEDREELKKRIKSNG